MPGKILVPFLAGMLLALTFGWPLILCLRRLKARQFVSSDAPERHQATAGTPTMGGLIILASGLAGCVLATVGADVAAVSGSLLPLLGVIVLAAAFTGIGFLDDLLIVRRGRNLGLKARQKLAGQFLFAIGFVAWVHSGLRSEAE